MELLVESSKNIYDISGMVKELSWAEALNDGASCLDFTYIKNGLMLDNGDVVRLSYNNQANGIFFGKVFKVSCDESGLVTVKAYDQLRYGKAKDIIVLENGNISTLVREMCKNLSLTAGTIEESSYILPTIADSDKTWIDEVYSAVSDTLIGTGNTDMYCLRDEYGKVCLWNMKNLQMPLVLGDESLVTGYTFEKSIDDDFYNDIRISWTNEAIGKTDLSTSTDMTSVNRYGILRYLESGSDIKSAEVAKARADNLLKLYNHEKQTLKLSCLGDLRVRAGNSIYGSMSDIGISKRLIIQKVTHDFLPIHTMEIEVIPSE